jgi:hypothetical protein
VRSEGIEPSRRCGHRPLRPACLPFHHERLHRGGGGGTRTLDLRLMRPASLPLDYPAKWSMRDSNPPSRSCEDQPCPAHAPWSRRPESNRLRSIMSRATSPGGAVRWGERRDLNPLPPGPHPGASTTSASSTVDARGADPLPSCVSSRRSAVELRIRVGTPAGDRTLPPSV